MVVSDDVRCWSTAVNMVSGCDEEVVPESLEEVVPVEEGEGVWCSKFKGVGGTRRTAGAFIRMVVVEKKEVSTRTGQGNKYFSWHHTISILLSTFPVSLTHNYHLKLFLLIRHLF